MNEVTNKPANDNKDPFEEFEFKPLTDGLGFHKKTVRLKDHVAASGLTSSAPNENVPDMSDLNFNSLDEAPLEKSMAESPIEKEFIESLEREAPLTEIKKPLLREEDQRGDKYKVLKKVEPQLKIDFDEQKIETPELDESLSVAQFERRYKKVPTAFMATLFDMVVGLTLSIVFLASMMAVIEIDLMQLILSAETQLLVQLSFVGMYFAILQLYMIISRSISQCTLGEWAFDIHVAQKSGTASTFFPLLVLWRAILVTATGLVTLPFLSMLIRRDIAAYLTGVQLFQER